ncbi:MAG: Phosphoribosylaminoimidazole carboxylase catalytic subunit (EC [uncultured Sulfurovum sp.]|uniref:N5-carboxyaminoimidazole ribonucleotide mutase n=1 Tax=uncultured Sulfurovum sp. TaxID=269237 RepID=A0A6S6TYR2_9BACT|nr:MAG: Phosphoribosylaminoimidazole carboxylase catalytic subunit (EC [uncultured Sulfurovum sp.]
MKFVSIIVGSKTNYTIMSECAEILEKFGVPYELIISSALRSPERTTSYIKEAELKGAQVFIAGAGMAAHLAGLLAATTIKPVVGVPMETGPLKGEDALLSTVMMPAGMPIGTVAIGSTGAVNAAYLAIQILALQDDELRVKLQEDRISKAKKVELDSSRVEVFL